MKRSKEEYEEVIKNSNSIAEVCRKLGLKPIGGNYRTINNAIKEYNININHFTGQGWNVGLKFNPNPAKPLDEILVENSSYKTYNLRNRLLKTHIKENMCECCGNTMWLGNPIPLELHHINGNNNDHRLENLMMLCPNCHSQTDNYRGKNKSRPEYKIN